MRREHLLSSTGGGSKWLGLTMLTSDILQRFLGSCQSFSSSMDAVNTPTSSRLEESVDDSVLSITINALLMIAYLPTLYFGHFFPIKYHH